MSVIEQAPERRQRADARRNRDRLLDTARRRFAADGPGVPLDEIARAAGVGIGTLYRHFPTRDDLCLAVVDDSLDELLAEAVELLDADDPGAALFGWLRSQLVSTTTFCALAASVVLDQPDAPACGKVRDAGRALLHRAQEAGAVRSGIDIDDLMRLVHAVAAAAEEGDGDHMAREARADRLFGLLLDGLAIRPSRPSG